jgi:imidazolonepropionase-like amidohydrolase
MWAGNQSLFVTRRETVQTLRAQAETAKVVTRDTADAGVGILAGCDALIPGFCVQDELARMADGGMTPLAALQSATISPARYLHFDQTLGLHAPWTTFVCRHFVMILDATGNLEIRGSRVVTRM